MILATSKIWNKNKDLQVKNKGSGKTAASLVMTVAARGTRPGLARFSTP
jgi:hypothetical protein